MKKVLKSAFIFLPLVILVFVVNIYADPASLINKTVEKQIAQAFLDGHNAEDVLTIDDRAMIEFYFELREDPVDCLVLGASRGMQISAETTGIANSFNAGVTGAEFRDMVSVYYMYKEKNNAPENVILVLEPWTVSETYISKRCITKGYYDFCEENNFTAVKTNNIKSEFEKWREMFSIGYFQQSINPVFSGDFNLKKAMKATDEFYGEDDIRHWDGSYSYGYAYRNMTEVEKRAGLNDVKTKVPDLIKNYVYSENLAHQLDTFVAKLVEDGVNVTFFIPPILPEYYEFVVNSTEYGKCFTDTWALYTGIADKYNIQIIGSYNPVGLAAANFYDVLHPTYEYVHELFAPFREER